MLNREEKGYKSISVSWTRDLSTICENIIIKQILIYLSIDSH